MVTVSAGGRSWANSVAKSPSSPARRKASASLCQRPRSRRRESLDRRCRAGGEVVRAIREAGGEAMSQICDVSDPKAVAKLIRATDEGFRRRAYPRQQCRARRAPRAQNASRSFLPRNGTGFSRSMSAAPSNASKRRAGDAAPRLRQDHQHQLGHGVQGRDEHVALRRDQGCDHRHDALDGERARQGRYPRQRDRAGPHLDRVHRKAATISPITRQRWRRAAPFSARKRPRTSWAPASSSPHPKAISSPANASWSMAAR